MDNVPYILEETDDYAVVYKPPKMHTCAKDFTRKHEKHKEHGGVFKNKTLLDWYLTQTRSVFDVMHRLDYETHGLVLFAKNEKSFHFFKDLQDKGEFVKEYSAVTCSDILLTEASNFRFVRHGDEKEDINSINIKNQQIGFPPCPLCLRDSVRNNTRFSIESYFRPYGPGRKLVRPVIEDGKKHKEIAKDKGGFYKTKIINIENNVFTVQIKRGFRHQIRCHLYWVGYPILNDPLYSNETEIDTESQLALRSHALFFTDPNTGKRKECRIEPLA